MYGGGAIFNICTLVQGGGGAVSPLGLDNVAGVFVVTIMGCLIASVFAIIEFLVGTRQAAKVTCKQQNISCRIS